jgi:hypothetical protein
VRRNGDNAIAHVTVCIRNLTVQDLSSSYVICLSTYVNQRMAELESVTFGVVVVLLVAGKRLYI